MKMADNTTGKFVHASAWAVEKPAKDTLDSRKSHSVTAVNSTHALSFSIMIKQWECSRPDGINPAFGLANDHPPGIFGVRTYPALPVFVSGVQRNAHGGLQYLESLAQKLIMV